MKWKPWIVGCVVGGALSAFGQAQTLVSVDEAAKRIGETVTFEAEVMGVASSPQFQATYVNFGGAYPFQKLSVLFAGEHESILTSCQLPRLNGRMVRITGMVEDGKKGPVIRVTDLAQITLLESKDRVSLDATGDGNGFRKKMVAALADHFEAGDFAELERVSSEWRIGKERFLDGIWKIARFYAAISGTKMSYPERFKRLELWQAAYPDSITPRLLHADAMVKYAWEARGSGVASTVKEEEWKLFRERLATARMEMAALNARRTECPQWFVTMQNIALGQQWSRAEYEALFEEAIAYEPEYLIYYLRKINYLQPKWHGKEGEALEFINSLPGRFPNGVGQELYARIAWSKLRTINYQLRNSGGRYFPDSGMKWEPIKAGFERIHTQYPQSNRMLNLYAIFAGKAGDWETAQPLLLELGDQFDMELWVTWDNVALARMWAGGKGLPDTFINIFR